AAGGQGAPSGAPPTACVAAFARQKSWYCTNRPRIRTRFRLPPWLLRKRLPPPDTPAFDRMIAQLLARLRARGIDTSRLERLQQIILRHIERLQGPEQLPSFLESLGFGAPRREDPQALARWRKAMAVRARAWWLRLLASEDPTLIAEGLRARLEALRGYDEAAALAAEAAIESIHAHQKLVEDVAGTLPLVGDAMDIVALARGETLAGDRMSTLDYVLTSVGLVGGEVLQHWLRGRETRRALEGIAQKAAVLDGAQRAALARKLGMRPEALERTLRKIDRALEASRQAELSRLDALAREGREAFEASAEAARDAARFAADTRQAQRQLEALAEAAARGDRDALRRAVLDWQKNKTAQALLLEGKDLPEAIVRRGPAFRERLLEEVAGELDGLYREVDRGVAQTLRESDEIRALARKRGLDPDAIEIEPLTITNKRPGQSAARPRPGRDRDVTYRIVQRLPDGSERAIDVPHEIARSVYERELWLRTRGEPLPDAKTLERYAESLDQTVTSRTHVEAYNPGEVALEDFLDKGKTPTLTRVEDVVDTVEYKSTHWFERARHNPDPIAASREVAEGMRQATKQYRDIVLSRVRQYYGDRWRLHVPPRLEKGMEIFDRVVRREITPAQAEAMLRRMGSSKEEVVRGMGMFLEALEKGPGHAWRKAQFPRVYQKLASIPFDRGSKAWTETALETVERALAEGRLTGSDFLRLHGQIQRGVLERLRRIPPAERPAARRWLESLLARRLIGRATFESLRRAVDAPRKGQ
ncbi:MAG: hypothetical protein D6776_10985, partial [Planctomycetota bacterium]